MLMLIWVLIQVDVDLGPDADVLYADPDAS